MASRAVWKGQLRPDAIKLDTKKRWNWCSSSTSPRYRKGRIFIDWLRNERGATAIAPFSVRARPGAPVACPVSRAELPCIRSAGAFTTAQALERGWADVTRPAPQSLTAPVIDALDRVLSDSAART